MAARANAFQFQLVFRIHCLRPAPGGLQWQIPLRCKFRQVGVRAGHVVRDLTFRPDLLYNDWAGICRQLLVWGSPVGSVSDQRGCKVGGIISDCRPCQIVAIHEQILGHRGFCTAHNAIAPNVIFGHVSYRDDQRISFPFSGREAFPGMGGILGRVRASIHPDIAIVCRPQPVQMPRNEPACSRIDHLVDSQIR